MRVTEKRFGCHGRGVTNPPLWGNRGADGARDKGARALLR